jgi:alpha-D-ribose 1-methylphosphonate 5-triphosphate synthase subunit PhnH
MGPSRTGTLTAVPRLSSDESRRVFRALLDAVARPGTIVELRASVAVDAVLLPALALADIEVAVAVVGEAGRAAAIGSMLRRSTGASLADEDAADLVVAVGPLAAATVARLRRGDAFRPEAGARLVIEAARVASVDPVNPPDHHGESVTVWLAGPGASGGRLAAIDGVRADVFEALQVANGDHPAGLDTWIVDVDGSCIGIPRSCRVEIVAQEDRWDT